MLDSLPINLFDAIVLGVVLLSALVALLRGFVKEVLSLAAWAGAVLVTLWGFAVARPYFRTFIDNQLLADIATLVALFIASLIVFAMVAQGISALVRRSQSLTSIDRSLGFVFGIFRGAVLLGLGWLALAWAVPSEKLDIRGQNPARCRAGRGISGGPRPARIPRRGSHCGRAGPTRQRGAARVAATAAEFPFTARRNRL
jgi:uncharacterized membrane protein required for colicin V production